MSDPIIGASMVKSTIDKLSKTITDLDRKNEKLQKTMLALTVATAILACLQAYPIIVNISKTWELQ